MESGKQKGDENKERKTGYWASATTPEGGDMICVDTEVSNWGLTKPKKKGYGKNAAPALVQEGGGRGKRELERDKKFRLSCRCWPGLLSGAKGNSL